MATVALKPGLWPVEEATMWEPIPCSGECVREFIISPRVLRTLPRLRNLLPEDSSEVVEHSSSSE